MFLLSDDLRKKNGVQISFGRTMKLLIGWSNKNQQKLKGGAGGEGGGRRKVKILSRFGVLLGDTKTWRKGRLVVSVVNGQLATQF